MTELLLRPADRGRAREDFIALPRRLYAGRPGFVPPLHSERRAALSPRKNPYFQHAEVRLWVAYRGGVPVGRISAQVDSLFRGRHDAEAGHFGFLDAVDEAAVFAALTGAAESWLAERGMRRALGPFSLSINEECGLLVEGFESRSVMMMAYHPPYAAPHLEALGYRKAKDLLAYDYDIAASPEIDRSGYLERVPGKDRVRVRTLDMRRYDADIRLILRIFNDAWSGNWGFVPMTEAEIAHAARSLRLLIRPDYVWIAEIDGEPAAMIVCLPNLNEMIADLDGRLFPFNWVRLLWRLKHWRPKSARVLLFGVRARWRGSALGAGLVVTLLARLREAGLRQGVAHAELSWILEDNSQVRRVIEAVGGRPYKTYRLFEKALA